METIPNIPAVVLIRHAQSEYNRDGRFTGWSDPPLTEAGVQEARDAGHALAAIGHRFDRAYTSPLQRASRTLEEMLQVMDQRELPRQSDWRLNERHYGALQGNVRSEAIALVGEAQVWRWRRGYEDWPPEVSRADPRHPVNESKYADVPSYRLPAVENLAATRSRVVEFWNEQIVPRLQAGERILIASHGNTLRALLMHLGEMNVAAVEELEIPTGTPIVYAFDLQARPMGWHYLEPSEVLRQFAAA